MTKKEEEENEEEKERDDDNDDDDDNDYENDDDKAYFMNKSKSDMTGHSIELFCFKNSLLSRSLFIFTVVPLLNEICSIILQFFVNDFLKFNKHHKPKKQIN